MNGNCHLVFGTALGTALAINMNTITTTLPNLSTSPETATLFVLGGLIGGILPDVDNPISYVGKLSVPVSTMFGTIGAITGKRGKFHRGILHDPAIYLVGLAISYLCFTPLVGLFIGCLSHLYLDMYNPLGVPFLLGTKHLHLGKILSGSKESILFTWMNAILVLAIGVLARTTPFFS